MPEEVTYADLKFHDRVQGGSRSSLKSERKDTLVSTPELPGKRFPWQRLALTLLGILSFALLGALVAMAVLFLQVSEKRVALRSKNKNISQALMYMKEKLCIRNEDTDEESQCLLCPVNWILHGRTCYSRLRNKQSWEISHQFCSARNSNLLIIPSEDKKKSIKEIFKTFSPSYGSIWIGLKSTPHGEWKWIDNTTVPADIIEPGDYHRNKCGSSYIGDSVSVYEKECTEMLHFICEKEAVDMSIIS